MVALDNGVGRTPQLGWNSWNKFGCDINEKLIRETAEKIVSLGLNKVGYEYVNMDDCWQNQTRNSDGSISADSNKFPSGMKTLSNYIHSLGLKFGLYSDAGSQTCEGYPGSRHSELIDAQTFASWGVDYLKYDNCYSNPLDPVIDRYTSMRNALNSTGRPIFYSICEWGVESPWLWAPEIGNSWRTDSDISDDFTSFLRALDNVMGLSQFAGPGSWNDPDMLEVGNGGMTNNEYRAHFSLWALFKAPLLIGCDLTSITNENAAILSNRELISWNQDQLGVAGDLIWKEGPAQVFGVPLADGSRGVVFLNRDTSASSTSINISISWTQLGYSDQMTAIVNDAWNGNKIGEFQLGFTASVGTHDGAAFRIAPVQTQQQHLEWRPWHTHTYRKQQEVEGQQSNSREKKSKIEIVTL